MNRTTAIFLALGILLAHSLSIHRDYQWRFAGPFDQVHLAYALGDRLALGHGAYLTDADDAPGLQAYPSPLWVGLAAAAKLLGKSIPLVAQMTGLIAGLLLLSISTRIAYNRVAGVIPPLLLVLSGTMASGAVCGTEHIALALFLVASFVAFEKNHPRWFALFLTLVVATRAEGLLLFGAWFLFWAIDRLKRHHKRPHPAWVFAPAGLVGAFFCLYTPNGEPLPLYLGVFHSVFLDPAWEQGFEYLRDFVIVAISPILLVLGFGFMLAKRLSGKGIRALVLALLWVVWMVSAGGESYPFGLAYLPVLPLMCLVIQETIVAALDTYRPSMEAASWVTLFLTAFAAASASRFPGDLGPLTLERPHTRWLQAKAMTPMGQDPTLGRTQLHAEIRSSLQMGIVADFFALHVPKGTSILSPWTGQLSYRTELDVQDWFGRMRSQAGHEKRFSTGSTRGADLSIALDSLPELVLPGIVPGAPMLIATLPDGVNPRLLNMAPEAGDIRTKVRATLEGEYELMAVPIRHPAVGYALPYFVYSRKASIAKPALQWRKQAGEWVLEAELGSDPLDGMPRLVDLVVTLTDALGNETTLAPSGLAVQSSAIQATLPGVILGGTAYSKVRLLTWDPGVESGTAPIKSLQAVLYHTGVERVHKFSKASAEVRLELP